MLAPEPASTAPPQHSSVADGSRLHTSRVVRWLFWTAGTIALLLGIVGAFLPVLPTTPFILVAAACYAKASERFHRRLLAHRSFGPIISEWEEHRSMPLRTKRFAVGLMSLSIAVSIWIVADYPLAQAFLVVVGIAAGTFVWRIPSRDDPANPSVAPTPTSARSTSADASR